MSKARLELTLQYDASCLAGYPEEYGPRMLVWSTDRQRMPRATDGMAAQVVPLQQLSKSHTMHSSTRGNVVLDFEHDGRGLPISDNVMAECCILVQACTQSDGHAIDPSLKSNPYHIRVGQVNLQWHSLLSRMCESGRPTLQTRASIQTLCGYESDVSQHDFNAESDESARVFLETAQNEASRGEVIVTLSVKGGAPAIETIRRAVLTANTAMPGGLSPSEHLARIDGIYKKGLNDYMSIYAGCFPKEHGFPFVRSSEQAGGETLVFKPDTPNMMRFHLPVWSTSANDHLPFAEWWLSGLKLPHDSDASTERYFRLHADIGLSRAKLDNARFVDTVERAFGTETPLAVRQAYGTRGTAQYHDMIRAVEATYYTATLLQLSCKYVSDGRYLTGGKRLQVEAPQRDAVSGSDRAMDCEDDEMTGSVSAYLLSKGLGPEGLERKWASPVLSAMATVMEHYAVLHTFGSVRGAKLADATTKSEASAAVRAGNNTPISIGNMDYYTYGKKNTDDMTCGDDDDDDEETYLDRLSLMQIFGARNPELSNVLGSFMNTGSGIVSAAWRKVLPESDSDPFWELALALLFSYVDQRNVLAVSHLAKTKVNHRLEVRGKDDFLLVDLDTLAPEKAVAFQQEKRFESLQDVAAFLGHTRPLWQLRFDGHKSDVSGDPYSGSYANYDNMAYMQAIFDMAQLAWSVTQTEKPVKINEVALLRSLTRFRSDVAAWSNASAAYDMDIQSEVSVHHRFGTHPMGSRIDLFNSMTASSSPYMSQHHHVTHWHRFMQLRSVDGKPVSDPHATLDISKEAAVKLSQRSKVAIQRSHTVSALHETCRVPVMKEVRRDARTFPKLFWTTVLQHTNPAWVQRVALVYAFMRGHGHEKHLWHYWMSVQHQYGAHRVYRNFAFWTEWFDNLMRDDVGKKLAADWSGASSIVERHKALHLALHEPGIITAMRYRPAKRMAKAMLDAYMLDNQLTLGISASFANRLYMYTVKAMFALGFAPVVFSGKSEEGLHLNPVKTTLGYGMSETLVAPPGVVSVLSKYDHSVPGIENAQRRNGWLAVYHAALGDYFRVREELGGHQINADGMTTTDTLDFYARTRRQWPPVAAEIITLVHGVSRHDADHDSRVNQRLGQLIIDNDPESASRETRTLAAAGMSLKTQPDWNMVNADCEYGVDDSVVLVKFAESNARLMPAILASNSLLMSLERANPFAFWLEVMSVRFPAFVRTIRSRLGIPDGHVHIAEYDQDLRRMLLPASTHRGWRQMYMWLAHYLEYKFQENGDTGMRQRLRYVYDDVNRIRDTTTGKVLTLSAYIQASGAAPDLKTYLGEPIFLDRDQFAAQDAFDRIRAINEFMTMFFGDEGENADVPTLVQTAQRTSRLVISNPMSPPLGVSVERASVLNVGRSVLSGDDDNTTSDVVSSDTMLIDNTADKEVEIGGHMYSIFMPLGQLSQMYQKHSAVMKKIYPVDGSGPHNSLKRFVEKQASDLGPGFELVQGSLPAMVGEGTGRQELMMLAPDHYFEASSNEFISRAANHVAEVFVASTWNDTVGVQEAGIDADLYGFQSHLFSTSMRRYDERTDREYDLRVSPFYRRLGHGVSEKLVSIDEEFGHYVWVRPGTQTFGANLRHALEGSDALPIPMPHALSQSYRGTSEGSEALKIRSQRLAPVSLRFADEPSADSESQLGSECHKDHPHHHHHHIHETPDKKMSTTALTSVNSIGVSDVYRTEDAHAIFANSDIGMGRNNSAVTFDVPWESTLANAIRAASGNQLVTSHTVQARSACFVTEPPTGPIHTQLFERAAQFIPNLEVKREVVHPETCPVYRLQFEFPVTFHLTQ